MAKIWKVPSKEYNHLPLRTYTNIPKVFYTLCEKRDNRWVPISPARYADPLFAAKVFSERLFRGNFKPRDIRAVDIELNSAK